MKEDIINIINENNNKPKQNSNSINEINKKDDESIIKDKKYYNDQVKQFMSINLKEPDYLNKIEKDPDSLFSLVDKNTILKWEKSLRDNNLLSEEKAEKIIEGINTVVKDTQFQTVIRNDCNRTRVRESIFLNGFKETLENILTYYCKSKNIYYKQGLKIS